MRDDNEGIFAPVHPGAVADARGGDDGSEEPRTGVFAVPDLGSKQESMDPSRTIAGRYEIVERVASGGMGQVLRVRHIRLGKEFALKLMHAELALDAEARDLFVAEAQLASTLSHPNIVSVVDFGEDPDWGLFLTMELLKGERLSARIKPEQRLPLHWVCHIGCQLAAALHHSHSHGVVHGDVKSENVLCVANPADDGDHSVVKLLDFGSACLASRSEADETLSGTPAYMAPERIVGGPAAPSNDIYALGVVLYELLTGETPFCTGSPAEVLEAHLNEPLDSVGARRGEVLDDELVGIVNKCLAKAPEDRTSTAAELESQLHAYLQAHGGREHALAQRTGTAPLSRTDAASDAFHALCVPAAGLNANGTIRIANAAFARLVGAEGDQELEGVSILETRLGVMHPGIRDDLRLAAMHGRLVRRRVQLRRGAEVEATLRLTLSPASTLCGSCMLVVHPLDHGPTGAQSPALAGGDGRLRQRCVF